MRERVANGIERRPNAAFGTAERRQAKRGEPRLQVPEVMTAQCEVIDEIVCAGPMCGPHEIETRAISVRHLAHVGRDFIELSTERGDLGDCCNGGVIFGERRGLHDQSSVCSVGFDALQDSASVLCGDQPQVSADARVFGETAESIEIERSNLVLRDVQIAREPRNRVSMLTDHLSHLSSFRLP